MANGVNYEDERLAQIEKDKKLALAESNGTIDRMVNEAGQFYQQQIDASQQLADEQVRLQNEQTDFTIEKIEQQKEQLHDDYLQEKSDAYVDYKKQSDDYGSNAEQMADSGLAHSGYSESSKVAMHTDYQRRVSAAKASYDQAKLNYDNGIKEAKLQNSSALAEIKLQAYQMQLELGIEGFNYKNSLIMEKLNRKEQIEDRYYGRFQDTVAQINNEKALALEQEQFEKSLAWEREQYDRTLAEEQRQFNAQYGSTGVGTGLVLNQNGTNNQSPAGVLQQQVQAHKQVFDSLMPGSSTSNNTTNDANSGTGIPKITSFSDAKAYLKKNNKTGAVKDLMSKAEWNIKNLSGTLPEEYRWYSSYNDYLQAYVEFAMMNT